MDRLRKVKKDLSYPKNAVSIHLFPTYSYGVLHRVRVEFHVWALSLAGYVLLVLK